MGCCSSGRQVDTEEALLLIPGDLSYSWASSAVAPVFHSFSNFSVEFFDMQDYVYKVHTQTFKKAGCLFTYSNWYLLPPATQSPYLGVRIQAALLLELYLFTMHVELLYAQGLLLNLLIYMTLIKKHWLKRSDILLKVELTNLKSRSSLSGKIQKGVYCHFKAE